MTIRENILPGPRQFIDAKCDNKLSQSSIEREHKGPWSIHKHTPPHLLLDETWYMISASTRGSVAYFESPLIARQMCLAIESQYSAMKWHIERYVVIPDHYHVVTLSNRGRDLSVICKRIHGTMSAIIRKNAAINCRSPLPARYFNNYWDTCLNSEKEWSKAMEYVRMNPLSSRLVADPDQWEFWGPKETASKSGNKLPQS